MKSACDDALRIRAEEGELGDRGILREGGECLEQESNAASKQRAILRGGDARPRPHLGRFGVCYVPFAQDAPRGLRSLHDGHCV